MLWQGSSKMQALACRSGGLGAFCFTADRSQRGYTIFMSEWCAGVGGGGLGGGGGGGGVGGGGGFFLLLASAVAIAHRYWGAFETLSLLLSNLMDAAAAFVRGRANSPPPSQPPWNPW